MLTALAMTHIAFENLGSLSSVLVRAGFDIQVIDACSDNLRDIDALAPDLMVVLGGPIGVYENDAYPFIETEIELLRSRLAAQLPTLGICLGAQLMAAALGARVYPGRYGKELGWAPIQAGPDVGQAPWFEPLLAPELRVLHWHGDTFDLPAGAAHLASTTHYANQAFAVGKHALALQFHPEVTTPGLERWYVGHACELSHTGIDVRQLRAESQAYGLKLEHTARYVWQQWLSYVFGPGCIVAGETGEAADA